MTLQNKIKVIDTEQLKVGMYVHGFGSDWLSHPFIRNSFPIVSENDIQKILGAGIQNIYIDTSKGLDVKDAPTQEEVKTIIEAEIQKIALDETHSPIDAPLAEEFKLAQSLKNEGYRVILEVMTDVRLGKAIDLERINPIVLKISKSVFRNPAALTSLLRIKKQDNYTFLHSLSVCALMAAFCRSVGMEYETIQECATGGLLHDIGKALTPKEVLNKPGALTNNELNIMKRHPQDGYDILHEQSGISQIVLDITNNHHERVDCSGYPNGLPESEISVITQMATIVDVYDAITSDRCYRNGVPPAEALRQMYELNGSHFNIKHLSTFIKCVGIYPVGTLVKLESGLVGVVIESHETSLLTPKINALFCAIKNMRVTSKVIDLSKPLGLGGGDRIVGYENPEKWNINPIQFLQESLKIS